MNPLTRFEEIWVLDFEFCGNDGDTSVPVCLVAQELKTSRMLRLWRDELNRLPFDVDPRNLFVGYFTSAEWNCFLALNWVLPTYCLDLYVEFRNLTNNRFVPAGNGLLGALTYFRLSGISKDEKTDARDLILSSGPWSLEEKRDILDYCQSDIEATVRLFHQMIPRIDLPRALWRGKYMQAVSRMETAGVPIDTDTWSALLKQWDDIRAYLIRQVDTQYGIYEGTVFKLNRFERYLAKHKIPWPTLGSGTLSTDENTFREMSRAYPQLGPLKELRATLGQLKLNALTIGSDGRNRCLLSPFRTLTGRNSPSTAKFVFGPAAWVRSLIKPPRGYGVAYVDWSQQEFAIAASLSRDENMQRAYVSEDPYMTFSIQAGMAPPGATKVTHKHVRANSKQCVLAINYGMGARSLAQNIQQQPIYARDLINRHKRAYPQFWRWSDAIEHFALSHNKLWTCYGWHQHFGPGAKKINSRSIRNFPVQGNGAEMLRLACIWATEAGLTICCPIHDAALLQSPLETLDRDIKHLREIMAEASLKVLQGFEVKTDVEVVRYPNRYHDERGKALWDTAMNYLDTQKSEVSRFGT